MRLSSTTTSDLNYDPYSAELAYDPHALFRRMRDEAPLYYSEEHDFYALSRFDDVERAHVEKDVFISRKGVTLSLLKADVEFPPGTVIMEDAPSHTIHRALLSRMFTTRKVAGLEPMIRQLCADLLDPLVGTGRFDFATDLGAIMPTRVVGMLIGIPDDRSEAVRDFFDDSRKSGNRDVFTGEIFAEYIDWRTANPGDDVISNLLHAEFEDETGTRRTLTREELLAYVNIVAAAGNDTTRRLISYTGKVLADHPDQRRLLVDDPSLASNCIEEMLRFEPPPLLACRYVASDSEWYGQTVPAGSHMALLVASANRDERKIDDPDRFDITRTPGQIFTFGFGAHYCLGQALARLQARIAIEEVIARFPEWEVDEANAKFVYDGDLRGWDSLPVHTT
ncbi:MAG TPA: cytochrome P450 [Microthrixaceae bacterium]|nr:cytochrome P450 [Microthrixaceae bacterium]